MQVNYSNINQRTCIRAACLKNQSNLFMVKNYNKTSENLQERSI